MASLGTESFDEMEGLSNIERTKQRLSELILFIEHPGRGPSNTWTRDL